MSSGVSSRPGAPLAEIRSLLSVMRSDGDGLELAPQPGLDSLDSLIKGSAAPGYPSSCT